jgi:hypothetical protein
MSRRKSRNQIASQFTALTIEMMLSPAWRVLTLAARRVLDRVSIEVRRHGGNQKDGVPVTYKDFEDYGIDHHSIAPAIREVVALGFVDIARPGRGGNADFRRPAMYRATFEYAVDCEPSHRWRHITSVAEARAVAAEARKQKPKPGGKNTLKSRGETPPESLKFSRGDSPLTSRVISPLTFETLGGGRAGLLTPTTSTRSDDDPVRARTSKST